jgi:translocation and assembly module TamB
VQSELAQQIQAEANLRLRGTVANPALLGRVNITEGRLTMFGNKYTIGQGTISFFNPVKIEPIVNMDLQTKARGVDVTITISGPMNKLNVTYRSDPPLQFSDIVALLATGRAPTTDPTLAARETGAAQSWQQMGASAIVSEALANPTSGPLQRFFGVSKIKIDPTLTGITNPQARLSIEQQVTPDITFTYITYLTQSNPQVIQVEWALNKQWSIVALRDENDLFGMDLYYKKRFK